MAERPNLDVALDDLIKAKPAKADRPPQERKERAEKPPHHKERSGGPVKQRGDRDSRRDEPISRGGRGGGRGGGGAHKGGDREWRHDRAPAAPRQQQIAPNPMMAGFYPGPPFMNPAAFFPQQAPVSKAPISLGAKVLVTNLDKEITAEDLREIFGQVGELKAVSLQFGADNKPKGVAEIVYRHRSGAEQAVREFDGREVDDVRIRVRIIGNDGESAAAPAHHMMAAAAPPAAAMFAPFGMGAGHHGAVGGAPSFAQIAAATTAGAGGKNPFVFVNKSGGGRGGKRAARDEEEDEEEEEEDEEEEEEAGDSRGPRRGGFRGARGGGRGRGGFGGRGRGAPRGGRGGSFSSRPAPRESQPATSADDLDSALSAYMSKKE